MTNNFRVENISKRFTSGGGHKISFNKDWNYPDLLMNDLEFEEFYVLLMRYRKGLKENVVIH